MSYPDQHGFSKDSGVGEAEKTLRLIASLPAPEGLEGRVHHSLRAAPRRARVLAWPASFTPAGGWLRGAAAAAIVFVVAGGGWGIYSRVQPGQPAAESVMPHVGAPGGFSEGGAVRRPPTLVGPVVDHPVVNQSQPKLPAKDPKKPVKAGPLDAKSAAVNKAKALPAASTVQ